MLEFLAIDCTDDSIKTIVDLLKNVVQLIQIGVPLLLILFGMLDLAKAVMAGKEDEMKKYQGALIKRLIYAVAVFLVVPLVTFVIGLVLPEGDWKACWSDYGKPTVTEPEA